MAFPENGIRPEHKRKALQGTLLGLGTLVVAGALAADPLAVTTNSGVSATLYGRVELDSVWNDNPTAFPTGSLVVVPQPGGNNQPESQISSGITRLGLNLSGPESDIAKVTGKIEADFWGSNQETPAPLLRLRYGNLTAAFGGGFSVLAGQADDLVNGLTPPDLDPLVLWTSGHLGFRRPQIRLVEDLAFSDTTKLSIAVAAAQPAASPNVADPNPDLQARVALSAPSWVDGKSITFGVAGIYGDQRYYKADDSGYQDLAIGGGEADLLLPVVAQLGLSGQIWAGQGLGAYYGNDSTGVSTFLHNGSEAATGGWGGWTAVSFQPSKIWVFNAGVGEDAVTTASAYLAAKTEVNNGTGFVNASIFVTPQTKFGLEVHRLLTSFTTLGQYGTNGAQLSAYYYF
jgi:hypothetical protein